MPKNEKNLEGVTCTGMYLTVHFTTGRGTVKRLEAIKVPWKLLLDVGVYEHLDRAEAIRLREHWMGQDDTLPPW